jgi:putative DNA methylase
VKLIAREGMPEGWDPTTDNRATCWEATQHLIRRLQNEGEESASELLARLGGDYGERARDLAYRLYSICERKGWAQEALAYNSLVIAWSEISKLSRSQEAGVRRQEDRGLFQDAGDGRQEAE